MSYTIKSRWTLGTSNFIEISYDMDLSRQYHSDQKLSVTFDDMERKFGQYILSAENDEIDIELKEDTTNLGLSGIIKIIFSPELAEEIPSKVSFIGDLKTCKKASTKLSIVGCPLVRTGLIYDIFHFHYEKPDPKRKRTINRNNEII
ncbi:MAG: hypothetical protein ABF289_03950 [Clostridiales bacterium]